MTKYSFWIYLLLFFLQTTICLADSRTAPKQTPEQFVRNFYQWYFEADKKSVADRNDEIFKYISPKTVEHIRSNIRGSDEYYVTKANSWTDAWTKVKIIVSKTIYMNNNVCLVPVTFNVEAEKYHVIVFVDKKNEGMRIIKIADLYPYS